MASLMDHTCVELGIILAFRLVYGNGPAEREQLWITIRTPLTEPDEDDPGHRETA